MNSLNFKADTTMSSRSTRFSILNRIQKWICFLLFMACGNFLAAQQPDQVDVSEFPTGFNYLGNSGDTLTFQFKLGTVANPVQDAMGYNLQFSFPELVSAPSSIFVTVEVGWLGGDDPSPEPLGVFDWTTKSLNLDYLRSDGVPTSGNGVVATISLIRPGGFGAGENSIALDGGVVMVENMDLRLGSPHFVNRVFPNPTDGLLYVEAGDPDRCAIQVWDMAGKILLTQPCGDQQALDLTPLPKGSYWLVLESDKGKWHQRVIRQ